MYCSNCGKEINSSTKYCPDCGCSVGSAPNYQAPASSYQPLKTQSEFVNDYLKKSSYYPLLIFSIIFDVIGTLVILFNTDKLEILFSSYSYSSSKEEAFIPLLFAIILWIIGSALMIAARRENRKANEEYNVYILTEPRERRNTYVSTPGIGEWKCPKCGKIHQNYVGSCGCGGERPK